METLFDNKGQDWIRIGLDQEENKVKKYLIKKGQDQIRKERIEL